MGKNELVIKLKEFKGNLETEIIDEYRKGNEDLGDERYISWKDKFGSFLSSYIPGKFSRYNTIVIPPAMGFFGGWNDTPYSMFLKDYGNKLFVFINHLIEEIESGDFDIQENPDNLKLINKKSTNQTVNSNKVFIVHGHDGELKTEVARMLEKLKLEPIILHEQHNEGQTVIEKFENNSDVGYAIILYSPDDVGNSVIAYEKSKIVNQRARQNVVFEHGYFVGKLGRKNVAMIVKGDIEVPSDMSGVVYIKGDWKMEIAKELKNAGFEVDLNDLS